MAFRGPLCIADKVPMSAVAPLAMRRGVPEENAPTEPMIVASVHTRHVHRTANQVGRPKRLHRGLLADALPTGPSSVKRRQNGVYKAVYADPWEGPARDSSWDSQEGLR